MSKKLVYANENNKVFIKVLVTGLVLLCSNIALGGSTFETSGNALLIYCNAAVNFIDNPQTFRDQNSDWQIGTCSGIIRGITYLGQVYQVRVGKKALFCTPVEFPAAQGARIVVKYLKGHPEELHEDGSLLIIRAFMEAYFCR